MPRTSLNGRAMHWTWPRVLLVAATLSAAALFGSAGFAQSASVEPRASSETAPETTPHRSTGAVFRCTSSEHLRSQHDASRTKLGTQ